MKKYLLPLVLLLPFTACKNDVPATTAVPPAPTVVTQPASNPPDAYLEGLYATSSAPGSGVDNLFGEDSSNEWRTQPGAGPDEGIMLYFSDQQPLQIAAVEITPVAGIFADSAQIQFTTIRAAIRSR